MFPVLWTVGGGQPPLVPVANANGDCGMWGDLSPEIDIAACVDMPIANSPNNIGIALNALSLTHTHNSGAHVHALEFGLQSALAAA